ncbi:MAG: phage tail protein [Geobacteraceae bacterium]|nr:phage tail protein [Geobacteraceae bacterium]
MAVYYVKTSTVGRNKITAFGTGGPAVNISSFAVGDSNGVYYEPTGEEAALAHQVWSGNANRVYAHPNHANWIVVEALIPANQGGFDIREALIKDDAGAVIAIGKYPLTNKPAPGSGSEKDLYVRMIVNVSDASAVNQTIDPSLIMSTQEYVDARMPHRVRVAATANLALAGLQIIDAVQLVDNDRVLLTAQTAPTENGIYIAHAGAWQRALDADSDLDLLAGLLATVSEGSVCGDTVWMLTTNAPITVGTTGLTFTKIYPDERQRTISDTIVPSGDTSSPTTLFGWLGYMIKSITGKANWRTAPATTLEAANGHMDRTDNPHNTTIVQIGAAAAGHNHTGIYEPANVNIQTHLTAVAPHSGHVNHSLATAVNDFLVASAAGQFVKKTLAEVKTILELGTAAFKNIGTAAGTVSAGDHGHANNATIGGPFAASAHNHTGVYEPANANIQTHIGTVGNPHSTTAAQVGAAALGHGHGNDANIGGPYAASGHTHTPAQVGTLPATTIYNADVSIPTGLWTSPVFNNKAVAVNIVPITPGVVAVSDAAASNAISWEVISDSTGSAIRVFNTTASAVMVHISIVTIG